MNYCEKCNTTFKEEICTNCGNKKTRLVCGDDFCFLFSASKEFGDLFKEQLNDLNIECVTMPYGNGVRSIMGLPLEYYNVYVQFKHYSQALEVYKELYFDPSDNLRQQLLDNYDKWHFEKEKTVKKIIKKLKLATCDEVFNYVKQKVIESNSIYEDNSGTHYIIVKNGENRIFFNFDTYEIYSI